MSYNLQQFQKLKKAINDKLQQDNIFVDLDFSTIEKGLVSKTGRELKDGSTMQDILANIFTGLNVGDTNINKAHYSLYQSMTYLDGDILYIRFGASKVTNTSEVEGYTIYPDNYEWYGDYILKINCSTLEVSSIIFGMNAEEQGGGVVSVFDTTPDYQINNFLKLSNGDLFFVSLKVTKWSQFVASYFNLTTMKSYSYPISNDTTLAGLTGFGKCGQWYSDAESIIFVATDSFGSTPYRIVFEWDGNIGDYNLTSGDSATQDIELSNIKSQIETHIGYAPGYKYLWFSPYSYYKGHYYNKVGKPLPVALICDNYQANKPLAFLYYNNVTKTWDYDYTSIDSFLADITTNLGFSEGYDTFFFLNKVDTINLDTTGFDKAFFSIRYYINNTNKNYSVYFVCDYDSNTGKMTFTMLPVNSQTFCDSGYYGTTSATYNFYSEIEGQSIAKSSLENDGYYDKIVKYNGSYYLVVSMRDGDIPLNFRYVNIYKYDGNLNFVWEKIGIGSIQGILSSSVLNVSPIVSCSLMALGYESNADWTTIPVGINKDILLFNVFGVSNSAYCYGFNFNNETFIVDDVKNIDLNGLEGVKSGLFTSADASTNISDFLKLMRSQIVQTNVTEGINKDITLFIHNENYFDYDFYIKNTSLGTQLFVKGFKLPEGAVVTNKKSDKVVILSNGSLTYKDNNYTAQTGDVLFIDGVSEYLIDGVAVVEYVLNPQNTSANLNILTQ